MRRQAARVLRWLLARVASRDAEAFIPLTVAVARFTGGVALVFDVGERELVVALPRPHAIRLIDLVLDAAQPDEKPPIQ